MASSYPGSLDSFATDKTNSSTTTDDHPTHHNDLADAVNKIEAELGTDPAGSTSSTVAARFTALFPGEGASTDWDPTLRAVTTDPTVTSVDGAYYRIGALMVCYARWVLSAGGSGTFYVALPANASNIVADTGDGQAIGSWHVRDNNGPANSLSGTTMLAEAGTARFRLPSGGLNFSDSSLSWQTGDAFSFWACYLVA